MSAVLKITDEDLMVDQLGRASQKLRTIERIEMQHPLETTPEWCLALREYNDAIEAARHHAANLRAADHVFCAWVEQLMRSHDV